MNRYTFTNYNPNDFDKILKSKNNPKIYCNAPFLQQTINFILHENINEFEKYDTKFEKSGDFIGKYYGVEVYLKTYSNTLTPYAEIIF